MALRADGSGDYAIRTAGGFYSPLSMSVCFWLLLESDRNASSAVWGIRETSSGVHYFYYYNPNGDGTTFGWENNAGQLDLTNLSLNTWYFVAMTRAGSGSNQTNAYRRLASAASLTSATGTFSETGGAINEEIVLSNGFATSAGWFPGRVAALKQWAAVLTADELLAESYQYAPRRFADLHSWRPMIHGSVANAALDFSGNGRDLTPNGSLLIADGPPIMWRAGGRRRYSLPAAAGGATVTSAATISSRAFMLGLSAVARVSAARIASRSGVSAQSAVTRVSAARISSRSSMRAGSIVSRVSAAFISARSSLRAAASLGGLIEAAARIAMRSSVRAASAVARVSAARISVQTALRGLATIATRLGAARILARTGLTARVFQDATPITVKVTVTPVTRANVSVAPVTRAKVTVELGG